MNRGGGVSGTTAAVTVYLFAEHRVCQSPVLQNQQFVVSKKKKNRQNKSTKNSQKKKVTLSSTVTSTGLLIFCLSVRAAWILLDMLGRLARSASASCFFFYLQSKHGVTNAITTQSHPITSNQDTKGNCEAPAECVWVSVVHWSMIEREKKSFCPTPPRTQTLLGPHH